MRASDLIGREVYDDLGNPLGRIADLLVTRPLDGAPAITHVLIARRRTRLFGYEREEIAGPWIIERLAEWLQGKVLELPYSQVHLAPPN